MARVGAGTLGAMNGTTPHLLLLCTGNAARSVMGGMMLSQRAPLTRVTTAGTHSIEGHPMSWRTRDAILAAGFTAGPHRSRQLDEALLADVDLVVAMAGDHVAYVRRHHPRAAARTATLRRLCAALPGTSGTLTERIGALAPADLTLEPWEDVADPAGGELADFIACAEEIRSLIEALVDALALPGATPATVP
jgi:protein-tyrosine phosphatase